MHLKITVPRFGTFRAYLDFEGLVVEDLDGNPAEANARKAVAEKLAIQQLAAIETARTPIRKRAS